MKKLFIFIFLAFAAFLLFLSYRQQTNKTPRAIINNHTFNLEIAKTSKEKEIGLAKYNNIPQNSGMLFSFEKPGSYSFWMKNMKFPIDIIFIRNNKIIKIFNNVPAPKLDNQQLPTYAPNQLSDTVLEINAGLSDKYNFKNGDKVKIKL